MSIVVEDGTGLSNAESYLSVSGADSYHTNRGNDSWTGSDAVKEQALRKATEYLDNHYQWIGDIYLTTQTLNWPRTFAYDSQGRAVNNIVPSKVENAAAELALLALSEDLVPVTTSSDYAKREKVGDLEIEYRDSAPASRQFTNVDRILSGLYTSKAGSGVVSLSRC